VIDRQVDQSYCGLPRRIKGASKVWIIQPTIYRKSWLKGTLVRQEQKLRWMSGTMEENKVQDARRHRRVKRSAVGMRPPLRYLWGYSYRIGEVQRLRGSYKALTASHELGSPQRTCRLVVWWRVCWLPPIPAHRRSFDHLCHPHVVPSCTCTLTPNPDCTALHLIP